MSVTLRTFSTSAPNVNADVNTDILDASISFRIIDNATIVYNYSLHTTQSTNDVEVYDEKTATLKRVE